jgi:septal ring factor EnvC (AmiA/AmiB activator)
MTKTTRLHTTTFASIYHLAITTMSLSNPTRPGAMSLLDKYAQINQNIEEARRRVAAARSSLETTNQSIENLREDRASAEAETAVANEERSAFEEEMKRVKLELNEKRMEKQRVEGEYRLAKRECSDTKRQIDLERLAFLEQCREFRSSCKRMRVAATILVLEGGFDEKGEGDVWRRLKEDVDLDEEGENVKGRKKVDVELERVIKDEKECREAFIEAECALHAARSEHKEAVQRCDGRNQKLAQQRAQLERHRKEVLELEREVGQVKDEIVKANQDAKGYENGECVKCLCITLSKTTH